VKAFRESSEFWDFEVDDVPAVGPPVLEFVDAQDRVVKILRLAALSEEDIKDVLREHGFVRPVERAEELRKDKAEQAARKAKAWEKYQANRRGRAVPSTKSMPRIIGN